MAVGQSGGPQGPDEKVSVSWLILQRLDDLKGQIAEVKMDLGEFRQATDRRFGAVDHRFESLERRWTWSLGILLAIVVGILAKLLIPGA